MVVQFDGHSSTEVVSRSDVLATGSARPSTGRQPESEFSSERDEAQREMVDRSVQQMIDAAFEELWTENGGGHNGQPHDGVARSCLAQFIDRSEILSTLLDDPRILGIATSLLGEDFNYMGSDGNYYVGDTGWHSDGWHEEILHIKIAFYLDSLTDQTGCLRVIPGSHQPSDSYAGELSKQIRKSQELWGIERAKIPAVAFETQPGDVVCFNHNIKHAALAAGCSL